MEEFHESGYVIDLYTPVKRVWMDAYPIQTRQSPRGPYFAIHVSADELHDAVKAARRNGIKFLVYEARWSRSADYRQEFFRHSTPPYRCRYCGRWLKREYMEVDHLVPVARVKRPGLGRNLLVVRGIRNVNDVRNLVPSCKKCNKRKGAKLGLWYVRGILGKYSWFRPLSKLVLAGLLLGCGWMAMRVVPLFWS